VPTLKREPELTTPRNREQKPGRLVERRLIGLCEELRNVIKQTAKSGSIATLMFI
jgi:hypothetical protein